MTTATPFRRLIALEPASEEAVAPFGTLIGSATAVTGRRSAFYDDTVTYQFSNFQSDEDTTLLLASTQPRPLTVPYLERHFKHTQTFIPLGGKPFIMVVAPPGDAEMPDLDEVRAFLFDGDAGFMLHIGTWHEFPFAFAPDTEFITIVREETYVGASSENVIEGEARNPDVDKKDLVRRLGVELRVEPPQLRAASQVQPALTLSNVDM